MHNPTHLPPVTTGISPIVLSIHLPEDYHPVNAIVRIADEAATYARTTEERPTAYCPAQQESRFRNINHGLLMEAMRLNELMRQQRDAIAEAQAALSAVALAFPERHARSAPVERLTPGAYHSPEARAAAAAEARHDSAAVNAQRTKALEALDLLAFNLRRDIFPV
jgi:hypothetical protein